MAAKLVSSTVSYGIGVRNRYSAFLDEDDGFGPPAVQLPITNPIIKTSPSTENKKSSISKPSSTQKANSKSGAGKQESQQKSGHEAGKAQKVNIKTDVTKPNQPMRNSQPSKGAESTKNLRAKPTNSPNDNFASNKQRGQNSNGVQHQSTSAKENNQHEGFNQSGALKQFNRGARDQRLTRGPRQYNKDAGVNDSNQVNSVLVGPSSEEEKRRRQQKRANDLRYKDQEKREAKRVQTSANTSGEQTCQLPESEFDPEKATDISVRLKGVRYRREGEKGENNARAFKGGRGRARRAQEGTEEGGPAAERKFDNGPQQDRRRNDNDRLQRNRTGFSRGTGPRANSERFIRADLGDRAHERQKPIPNFSDRSDFPSLSLS